MHFVVTAVEIQSKMQERRKERKLRCQIKLELFFSYVPLLVLEDVS